MATSTTLEDVGAKALLTTQSTVLKAVHLRNDTAAIAYFQLFNANAAADVTLGTTVPEMSFSVAAAAQASFPLFAPGHLFELGVVHACTTDQRNDTAVGAGVNVVIEHG